MTTYTTGIPLIRRNIQPPPIPERKITVNKIVNGGKWSKEFSLSGVGFSGDSSFFNLIIDKTKIYPDDSGVRVVVFNVGVGTTNSDIYDQISVDAGVLEDIGNGLYDLEFTDGKIYFVQGSIPLGTLFSQQPNYPVGYPNYWIWSNYEEACWNVATVGIEQTFHITIKNSITGLPLVFEIPITQGQPLVIRDVPYGSYEVIEMEVVGYNLVSITPSMFVISAEHPQQVVGVVNENIGDALELTWDDIANVPVADASSVSDWNTFFDLPTNGSPFTSVEVVGDVVKLRGGGGITLKDNLLHSDTSIIAFNDNIGCIIGVGYMSLADTDITEINFPELINVGGYAFYNTGISEYVLPKVKTIASGGMSASGSDIFYAPMLENLGETVGDDAVFGLMGGSVSIVTIPSALMTCNAGSPDGDIQYLIDNNTVTIFDPDNNQIYP